MKKLILGSFAIFLAHGALAQAVPPAPAYMHIPFSSGPHTYDWRDSGKPSTFEGEWIKIDASNYFLNDTSGAMFVGRDQNTSFMNLTLNTVNNPGQRIGRITQVYHSATTVNTTIHSTDDSSLTGTSVGYQYGSSLPDNAITVDGVVWANFSSGNWVIDEGNYIGGGLTQDSGSVPGTITSGQAGLGGAILNNISSLSITGASFYAASASGTQTQGQFNRGGTGLYSSSSGNTTLLGTTGKNEATGGHSGSITYAVANDVDDGNGFGLKGLYADGGAGAVLSNGGDVLVSNYDFTGGGNVSSKNTRNITVTGEGSINNNIYVNGGIGLYIPSASNITLSNGTFKAGNAGSADIIGPNTEVSTYGGHGAYVDGDDIKVTGNGADEGVFTGGKGASGKLTTRNLVPVAPLVEGYREGNGQVWANGGSGLYVHDSSSLEITGITASGANAGNASVSGSNSTANASGGHGLWAINTDTTIHSGTFSGGNGATATATGFGNEDNAEAYAGAGVMVSNGDLIINGGTFTGGSGGSANGENIQGNIGVWVQNGALTIDQASADIETLINGDVIFSGSDLDILGGTITGDIQKYGAGTAAVSVSTNAAYSGSFIVGEGDVDVTLNDVAEGKFFSKVDIADESSVNFLANKLVTKGGSSFALGGSNSVLSFAQGADLSAGSSISAGYGTINSSAGNLTLGENSSISLAYNGLSGVSGTIGLGAGSLVMTNTSARLNIIGAASTTAGSATFVTGGASSLATNANVQADLGWMVNEIVDTSAGIKVDWTYNSLTNSSLSDLDHGLLVAVDAIITNTTASQFFAMNSAGADGGTQMLRYSLSQLPDVSESSFQVSQQINQQLAARGTEFRSMNGFASTKPSFGEAVQPVGAAGPDGEDKTMQGWVRAYGSFGNRDKSDNFAAYDSSSWGTVVGVDKSFGKLLVGLAGGYARTDLDAGDAYEANVDTYYGSLYSTIGGERIFLDLAATYGIAKTKENNALMDESNFDSDILSFYIGGGMSFDVKENLSITPEASLLASYYNQESFDRTGLTGTGTVQEYDTSSYLGALGVNFATQHQMDWLNQGLAFIPEVRAHWLHEFNPDPDSFFYTIGGVTGPSAVRPRDEDLLRIGVGFDLWNWKYQSTKFEIDYDGLFSSTYAEHIFSGKITVSF